MDQHDFLKQYEQDLDNVLHKSAASPFSFVKDMARPVMQWVRGKPVGKVGKPAARAHVGAPSVGPRKVPTVKPSLIPSSDRLAQHISNNEVANSRILPEVAGRSAWNKVYNVFAEPWTGTGKLLGRIPGLGRVRNAMDAVDHTIGAKFTPTQYDALAARYGRWGKAFSTADRIANTGIKWGSRAAVGNYVLGNVFPNAYVGDQNTNAGSLRTKVMQNVNKPLSAFNNLFQVPINGERTRITPMSLTARFLKNKFIDDNRQYIDQINTGINNRSYTQIRDGVENLFEVNPMARFVYENHKQALQNDPAGYGRHIRTLDSHLLSDEQNANIQTAANLLDPNYHADHVDQWSQNLVNNMQEFNNKFPAAMNRNIDDITQYLNDPVRLQNDLSNLVTTQSGRVENAANRLNTQVTNAGQRLNDPVNVQNDLNRAIDFLNTQSGRVEANMNQLNTHLNNINQRGNTVPYHN